MHIADVLNEHPALREIVSAWNILIVEDEPDNSEILIRLLKGLGAQVNVAVNGEQALTMMHDLMPTFVLCDLSMYGMDGWTLKQRISQDEALNQIPVIALTAHAMAGDHQRVLAAGFAMYFAKPLDLIDFLLTMAEWSQRMD
jgi:CheY-like chemotaxis protein